MQLTTITFLLFVGNCVCFKQFTEDEYSNCFDNILCKLNQADVVRTVLTMAGPGLRDKGYQWLNDEGLEGVADTDEFWQSYPAIKCAQSIEKRMKLFEYWTKHILDHWTLVCQQNPLGEECTKCDEAMVYMNELIAGYFASGDCETEVEIRAREEAEKLAAEVPPLKMPSFG